MEPCATKIVNNREYRCYFELALQIIGGKWKPIILYHLAIDGVKRFGELRRSIPGITERMLTRQLRELEKDEIIHRQVYQQVPPRVEYTLRPLGIKLIPILLEMRTWGMAYERCFVPENQFINPEYESSSAPDIASIYLETVDR